MNEDKRRILHLVVEGLPEAERPLVAEGCDVETVMLTEANAAEVLGKIFTADAVSVWGRIEP